MKKLFCYRVVEKRIFRSDFIDGLTNEAAKKIRQNCNCLPSCSSIKYEELVYYATLRLFWRIRQRKYETMILPLQQTDINTEASTSKH